MRAPVSNRAVPHRVRWGVELLDPRHADHVLEIGPGSGSSVDLLLDALRVGTLTVVDRSPAAMRRVDDIVARVGPALDAAGFAAEVRRAPGDDRLVALVARAA